MNIPGAAYSLLLAIGAWCVDYFTSGDGSASIVAPVIVAAVPIVLKMFTALGEETPEATARGVEPAQKRGYISKVLLG